MTRKLLGAREIEAAAKAGRTRVEAPRGEVVVTPAAWSRAHELGVTIAQGPDGAQVKVVRGDGVQLARFPGAGADRDVQLKDVVTAADRSPMGAGFMAWKAKDSFPWHLTYDEVDYVIEGVLHLTVDGVVHEAKAGDVVFIPRGTRVVFGTPSAVRLFYVTHPASWGG